jgi:hypothetical protein
MISDIARQILEQIVVTIVPVDPVVSLVTLNGTTSGALIQKIRTNLTMNIIESTERHKTVSSSSRKHVLASRRSIAGVRTIRAYDV